MTNRNNKFTAQMSAPRRGHYECAFIEDGPVSDPPEAEAVHAEGCSCVPIPSPEGEAAPSPGGEFIGANNYNLIGRWAG